MQQNKRKKLQAKGWKVGSTAEFLDLSPQEATFIEMKISLAQYLKSLRLQKGMSQTDLANLIESSQSRVAKMEAGEPSVSIDLLIKSLLALGASQKDLAKTLAAA